MWQLIRVGLGLLAFAFAASSCAPPTSFHGDAQFPGGALGCFNQCAKSGMEMASFVYVGAYSTACACKPKLGAAAASNVAAGDIEGALAAATAGVELQRRAAEEAQRAAAVRAAQPPPLAFH